MLVNARRRRRRRRNRNPNPFAGVNRPRRRRRSRRRNPFASANMPRRRGRRRRGYRRNQPARVPRTIQQFLSAAFLTDVAFAGLGAITPSFVTDRLLPMMGGAMFDLRGMPFMRRIVQFAVPTVALWFAPRGFGRQASSFAIGAYAVTAVGLINDFTGGMVGQLGAYEPSAPISGLGRYELSAPGVGMNEDEAEILYAE